MNDEAIKQFNVVIFGTNGTGKTTEFIDIGTQYIQAKESIGLEKNFLLCVSDDNEKKYDWLPEIDIRDVHGDFGLAKVICNVNIDKNDKKTKTIYQTIYENYALKKLQFNGMIANDDMGVMMSRRPNDVLTMMGRRRQMNLDLLWCFHGLTTDCPPAFIRTLTQIVLFKTTDNHKDTMDKLGTDKAKEFERVYFKVQAYSNGNMLDAKGNIVHDKRLAVYNKEGFKLPYYKEEINLI